eukprot:g18996.t1
MQYSFFFLAVLALLGSAVGFQVAPRGSLMASRSAGLSTVSGLSSRPVGVASVSSTGRRRSWVTMQFGEGGGPIEKGTMPSYEEEQEKAFFNSELDNAPAAERVKDPVVLITLGWIVGIFLLVVGLILNGVN